MNFLFLALSINIKARTGDAVHVRELSKNLAKLGHHVSLIAGYSPEQSDELQSLEKSANIQISYNKNLFKILIDENKRKIMGKNGCVISIKNYTWTNTARRIINICTNNYNS